MRLKILVALWLLAGCAFADPQIYVLPALAPNGWGSASFSGWQDNAIYALENGLSAYGDPTLPTYYQQAGSSIPQSENQVTSFNSWMGQTDPGTVFGSAFASELGNRLHFGLVILGNGTQFSISQLSFVGTSSDPANYLGFGWNTGDYDYSPGYVGVVHHTGGADTYVTSGPNTQLVDELYSRGSGNAAWPCGPGDPSPCGTPAEQQAAIDAAAAYNGTPYTFSGTYTLAGPDNTAWKGTAEVTLVPTPEPMSIVFLGTVLCGVFTGVRRKYRRA